MKIWSSWSYSSHAFFNVQLPSAAILLSVRIGKRVVQESEEMAMPASAEMSGWKYGHWTLLRVDGIGKT
jgi:hypothetical protein